MRVAFIIHSSSHSDGIKRLVGIAWWPRVWDTPHTGYVIIHVFKGRPFPGPPPNVGAFDGVFNGRIDISV